MGMQTFTDVPDVVELDGNELEHHYDYYADHGDGSRAAVARSPLTMLLEEDWFSRGDTIEVINLDDVDPMEDFDAPLAA